MKNRFRLLSTTLLAGTLLITGCSCQKADAPDEKKPQTFEKKNDFSFSAKEVTKKNMNLVNEISTLEAEIAVLEKKINETNPGVDRAKIVKNKVQLEKKVEEIRNQQIDNAKAFQVSQQKKSKQIATLEEKEALVN